MNGFKRNQSKVFWNHMESRDLGQTLYSRCDDSVKNSCDKNIEDFHEDTLDSVPRAVSAVIGANVHEERDDYEECACESIKTISICSGIRRSVTKVVFNDRSSHGTVVALQEEEYVACENRSCSPVSHGHRSQDSGFSDSERSGSPEICDDVTSRRRTKKRRSRERKHRYQYGVPSSRTRLGSLWKEGDAPPDPAHTSTPKRKPTIVTLNGNQDLDLLKFVRTGDNRRVVDTLANSASSSSLGEECLGDFLYANEPPEDDAAVLSSRNNNSFVVNCLEGETTVRQKFSCQSSEEPRHFRQLTAVKAWLSNLAVEMENECSATLQSKALPRRRPRQSISEESQTKDLKLLTSSATAAATKLLIRADQFDRHYQCVLDKVTHVESDKSQRELVRSFEEDALSILSELGTAARSLPSTPRSLLPTPRRFQQRDLRRIVVQLNNLKDDVDQAFATRLDFYIERVVRGLEEAPEEGGSATRGALAALTALGLAGSRAGNSIARCFGVRALLTSLVSAGRLSSDLRAASLRALASVCCCQTAIEWFVRDGGPEILVDLLAAESFPETERMEAAALVVQITAPWTNAFGLPHLEPYKDVLVRALTRLAESTVCSQTLLLAAAALNYLSKSRKYATTILEQDTVRKLLKCVKKSAGGNVWLMEQVASLIGELARIPEARPQLAKARASVALVCFLRMRPPGLEDAYQRLEVTAAAALTRLCVDPEVARQVVDVGGADCLASCRSNELFQDVDDLNDVRLLKYTKSLRLACRKAAKEIDVARACDSSTFG